MKLLEVSKQVIAMEKDLRMSAEVKKRALTAVLVPHTFRV
jgi:hypothetical protein